jgi:ATP-dependent 26S proteasome regulatory subunit
MLEQIFTRFNASIPIVAMDCLSPEVMKIVGKMVWEQGDDPVYFWNVGTGGMERMYPSGTSDYTPELNYDWDEPETDPYLYVLKYIEETDRTGIFILEDIHPYINKGEKYSIVMATTLKNLYHRLSGTRKRVLILGQGIDIHPSLSRLIHTFNYALPSANEIADHISSSLPEFKYLAKGKNIPFFDELTSQTLELLGRVGLGLTLSEIKNAMCIFAIGREDKSQLKFDEKLIDSLLEYKVDLLKNQGIELVNTDHVPVGGLDLLKEWLAKRQKLFTKEAEELGLPSPKGILLAGPPGTGKSLVAKLIGKQLQLPLLRFDIASLMGSYVGESEGNVKRFLQTVEAVKPCVVWIDEVEKAIGNTGDSSGVSQRILGQILTFMQESKGGVFFVATANNVQNLPAEFKRKGRFDENFFIDLPNSKERVDILKIHLARYHVEISEAILDKVAGICEGFSGAELETVASEATIIAFNNGDLSKIGFKELEEVIKSITPLSKQVTEEIEAMRTWASLARRASTPETQKKKTTRSKTINHNLLEL